MFILSLNIELYASIHIYWLTFRNAMCVFVKRKFDDTIGVIISYKSKDRQSNGIEGTHTRQAMARSNTTQTKILYDHPLIWKSHWTPEYVNK
jgi:hypothetical protein